MNLDQEILATVDEGVKTLTLNIPKKRNAIAPEHALRIALEVEKSAGDGTRVLVLAGAGGSFCAGADLSADPFAQVHVEGGRVPREQVFDETVDRNYHRMIRAVYELPRPVIAVVEGAAAGIGCSLALVADLTLAAAGARFIELFVNIALMPDGGSCHILPRLVGMKKAMEMVLTGEPVTAEEALALGMITRVCPPEELVAEAGRLARKLASGPLEAMGVIKRTMYEAQGMGFKEALDMECRRQARLMTQPDFIHAARAFFRKQKPTFT